MKAIFVKLFRNVNYEDFGGYSEIGDGSFYGAEQTEADLYGDYVSQDNGGSSSSGGGFFSNINLKDVTSSIADLSTAYSNFTGNNGGGSVAKSVSVKQSGNNSVSNNSNTKTFVLIGIALALIVAVFIFFLREK